MGFRHLGSKAFELVDPVWNCGERGHDQKGARYSHLVQVAEQSWNRSYINNTHLNHKKQENYDTTVLFVPIT